MEKQTILVLGAKGFIGRHICQQLALTGYQVIQSGRTGSDFNLDYADMPPVDTLSQRLKDLNVVGIVNATGIIEEHHPGEFEQTHHQGPAVVYNACRMAGVSRVVLISALGADTASTPYFSSKLAGESALRAAGVAWQILRPSLVYGPDGASSSLFRALAAFPVQLLPGVGRQLLQPVHIEDLAITVARLLDSDIPANQVISGVGPAPLETRKLLSIYRQSLALPPAFRIPVPFWLIRTAAPLVAKLTEVPLTTDMLAMLLRGSTGDSAELAHLLGKAPREADTFVSEAEAGSLRAAAVGLWRGTLIRGCISFIWLSTAIISLVYPGESSKALLIQAGIPSAIAGFALYSSIFIDFLFGVLTLVRPNRRLWLLQLALVLGYSIVIGYALPEYLAHPFGPITKNVPILGMLILLLTEETRP